MDIGAEFSKGSRNHLAVRGKTKFAGDAAVTLLMQHFFHIAVEGTVKIPDGGTPVLLPVGNHVKVFLHIGGKVIIQNIGKIIYQEIRHYEADFLRQQLSFLCA